MAHLYLDAVQAGGIGVLRARGFDAWLRVLYQVYLALPGYRAHGLGGVGQVAEAVVQKVHDWRPSLLQLRLIRPKRGKANRGKAS